jgi:putative FmdB family regulatory protein
MPLFDYQCQTCGRVKEVLQRTRTVEWPDCCDRPMYPLPSAPSFKVNGYSYANGYTSESNN